MGDTPQYDKLTDRQKRFVELYFTCGMNATAAARKMGYKGPRLQGHRMITNANIKAAMEEKMAAETMSANEVLYRLKEQAEAHLKPFIKVTSDGHIYFDFAHPEAEENLHLIKKIKTKRKVQVEGKGDDAEAWEHEWVEVDLYDAQAALKLIGQYHALFTERTRHEGLENLTINVNHHRTDQDGDKP